MKDKIGDWLIRIVEIHAWFVILLWLGGAVLILYLFVPLILEAIVEFFNLLYRKIQYSYMVGLEDLFKPILLIGVYFLSGCFIGAIFLIVGLKLMSWVDDRYFNFDYYYDDAKIDLELRRRNQARRGWCILKHKWGKWQYHEDSPCEFFRQCKRCNNTVSYENHNWGEWQDESENRCYIRKVKLCQRCGQRYKGERIPDHEWNEWCYESEHSCYQVKVCKNCQEHERSFSQYHDWGLPIYSGSCIGEKVCDRCGAKEYIGDHTWEPESYSSSFRHCKACGVTEELYDKWPT